MWLLMLACQTSKESITDSEDSGVDDTGTAAFFLEIATPQSGDYLTEGPVTMRMAVPAMDVAYHLRCTDEDGLLGKVNDTVEDFVLDVQLTAGAHWIDCSVFSSPKGLWAERGVHVIVLEDADSDGYNYKEDCDDHNADIHPDAPEDCDEVDQNCDGVVDDRAAHAMRW